MIHVRHLYAGNMASFCPHINILGDYTKDDILRKQQSPCQLCGGTGINMWVCLHHTCLYVGCGEAIKDCSTLHFKDNPEHALALNISTFHVWCYVCESEVFLENNTPPVAGLTRRILGNNVYVATSEPDSDEDMDNEDPNLKPRGLTGLQNIGNTCYLNAAIQALSNCPPLTQFFLQCGAFVRTDKKPGLSKNYMKLMMDMWHKKRPSYVVPSSIAYGIKLVCPMFRGCTQQDSQEFLRCFMDQLHEELKEPVVEFDCNSILNVDRQTNNIGDSDESSQSEEEYETCDSGLSSEKSSYSDEGGDQSEGACLWKKTHLRGIGGNRKSINGMLGTQAVDNKDINASSLLGFVNPQIMESGYHSLNEEAACIEAENEFSDAVSESTMFVMEEKVSRAASPQQMDMKTSKPIRMGSVPSKNNQNIYSNPQNAWGTSNGTSMKAGRRKKQIKHRSVISDVFDGKILSSVQCLTCDRISSTKETFQDLSLPIPSREYLNVLHASQSGNNKGTLSTCTDVYSNQGLISWMFEWMKSWFWGPTVSLQDCLAAFFSADELKGDNMYSCEKCKKLRNGIKYSKVLELPEILCVHLKRFRHEVMFSSKINSYVSFPLEDLDMRPFLHKDLPSITAVTSYDLVAVICHHGTAGGGHYTAYALNYINDQWYEFDDQCVTAVDPQVVANCEAYVLFYRKSSEEMIKRRQRAVELMERGKREPSLMHFYISKQWVNKFNTFAEPGPIDNTDFLCPHGGVHPSRASYVEELCTMFSQGLWEYLYDTYGGGPACSHLYICPFCQQELELLERRQKQELEEFIKLHKEFQGQENSGTIYAINMNWFRMWENFVRARENDPPGPIDNSGITVCKNGGQLFLKIGSDYAHLSEDMWHFLHSVYGGGPELTLRQSNESSGTSACTEEGGGNSQTASASVHSVAPSDKKLEQAK